jgi:hypothetical protein
MCFLLDLYNRGLYYDPNYTLQSHSLFPLTGETDAIAFLGVNQGSYLAGGSACRQGSLCSLVKYLILKN